MTEHLVRCHRAPLPDAVGLHPSETGNHLVDVGGYLERSMRSHGLSARRVTASGRRWTTPDRGIAAAHLEEIHRSPDHQADHDEDNPRRGHRAILRVSL